MNIGRIVRAISAAVALTAAVASVACGRADPLSTAPAVTPFTRLYVGTYTTGTSRGIYEVDFDETNGRFTSVPLLAAESVNPSFLAINSTGRYVYAVNELREFQGQPTGAVSAFAVDPADGHLTLLNQQSSAGTDPCFIVLDPGEQYALVANYTSGTVAVLPIAADGRLRAPVSIRQGSGKGPTMARQEGPHAHHIAFDPASRFALWTDLGTDRVMVDRYEAETGQLTPNQPGSASVEAGSGPRHLAWHPSGRALYLLNELSSTVTTMSFDASTGALTTGRTNSSRSAGHARDNTAAEIAVSANGAFLYTSNRGDDTVAVFAIDARTLEPAIVRGVSTDGRSPRHFAIDPTGRWLIVANQESNSLVVFRIDEKTGVPVHTGSTATIVSPVDIVFARK